MRFLLLCFVIYFKKYINNNSYLLLNFSNNNNRSIYTGNYERYPMNDTNDEVQINNTYKNKNLLDILENDKISINTNFNLLEDKTIKPINLTASDLMDGFNFIMI